MQCPIPIMSKRLEYAKMHVVFVGLLIEYEVHLLLCVRCHNIWNIGILDKKCVWHFFYVHTNEIGASHLQRDHMSHARMFLVKKANIHLPQHVRNFFTKFWVNFFLKLFGLHLWLGCEIVHMKYHVLEQRVFLQQCPICIAKLNNE